MSGTLARLILAIAVLLAAPMVYFALFFLIYLFLSGRGNFETGFLIATVVACVYLSVGWLVVWRSAIRWDTARIGWTVGCWFASTAAAVGVGLGYEVWHKEFAVWMVLAAMMFFVVWIISTTLVWRETPAERAERLSRMGVGAVACPRCGYNLTGIREAKCPECGAQFTLDQLIGDVLEKRAPATVEDAQR